jgi:hypothetical protein
MRRAELSRQAAFETEAAFLLAARGSELGTGSSGTVSCMYVRASELHRDCLLACISHG